MRRVFLLPRLLMLATVVIVAGLAACSMPPAGSASTAFVDCFNHPPLYRTQNGCDEGN